MSADQKTFFDDAEAKGPVNGKSAQRLFVPKLLTHAAMDYDKRTPERDRAYEIIKKWAALEASGKLHRMKETNLEGEFFADVFSSALGYTIFSQNLPQWDLRAKFPVEGQTADGAIGVFRHEGHDPPRVLIELKGPKSNIDRDRASGRTPVQQCWDYLNLVPQCPWGLVCNYVSFRLYHRNKTPRAYEQFHLRDLTDVNNFREFYYLFERGGFLPSLIGQAPRCDELLRRSENQQQEVGNKLYKFYHEQRVSLINYLRRAPHGKSIDDAIYIAQKLLDRVFFIAFCQYRLLLPESTIERAWRDIPAFSLATNPRWENFKQLFRSIDKGNMAANISPFNGGLFETDAKVDDLQLDDQWTNFFREIGSYDFKDEVSVDVLGHLFEQSITDLETLRTDPDAELAREKKKTAGKRKREGVYYTPAFITQFIVRETIGPCLRERFRQLAEELGVDPAARVEDRDAAKWRAYQLGRWEILRQLRVCDPACGSGAFLIQALDYLEDWYADVVGELSDFADIDADEWEAKISPTILHENLFGVDLSPEAVEITALSLWIRTAERGKTLADLSHNIQCGNSVVSDPAVHPKAFNWQAAFPEVFSSGGFDVVVGNPPYVRQELLTAYKPHWETRFAKVFSGTSDIYVYFYALGCDLLRPKGRLAFISSSGFARAGFAENLRRLLADEMQLEQFMDLGDTQIFADAKDVYPAIVVLSKPEGERDSTLSSVRTIRLRRADNPEEINELLEHSGRDVPLSQLSPDGWQFDEPEVIALREKLQAEGQSLSEYVDGRFYRGLITGLNEAFVVSTETKNAFIKVKSDCATVLKPFVGGQDLRRWHHEDSGNWLILFPDGATATACGASDEKSGWNWLAKKYPPIAEYLAPFAAKGRKRLDQGQFWWELRPCDYYDAFERPKIMYPDIAKSNRFTYDPGGQYASNTTYFLPVSDWYLLGVLNSKATWFSLAGISTPFGERAGEFRYRLFSQYISKLPVPMPRKADRKPIAKLAEQCCRVAAERYGLQSHVKHRLLSTFAEAGLGGPMGTLNQNAEAWWELSVNDLGAALKTSFKLSANPLKNPRIADQWESYLSEQRAEVARLSRELADAEADLNARVFRLFNLTPAEIALLQREVEH